MRHGIVIALLLLAVAAWIGAVVAVIAGNRSFYPWHRPLCDAGVLPPNGRGPALTTWRRLLGGEPEHDPMAEAHRSAAKRWFLRFFGFAAAFAICLGLALLADSF
jgi:hypothetical protein